VGWLFWLAICFCRRSDRQGSGRGATVRLEGLAKTSECAREFSASASSPTNGYLDWMRVDLGEDWAMRRKKKESRVEDRHGRRNAVSHGKR
jgi:hypothetical protein